MSVAMALAEVNHHSAPRRPKTARARGWTRPEQIVDVPVPDVLVPRRLPPPQEVPATLVPLLAQQETSIDGKTLHFLIWRTFMDRKALEEQERKEQEVVEWTEPHYFSVATPRATALDVPVLADDDGFFGVVSPALAVLPAPGVEYVSPASAVISIPAVAEQVIDVPKLALLFVLFSARLCLSRSWWNSWWKCRLCCPIPCSSSGLPSRSSIFRFRAVEEVLVEVFKVFPKDRVPQRLPVSRPSFLLVEVFMVSLPDRVQRRFRPQNAFLSG